MTAPAWFLNCPGRRCLAESLSICCLLLGSPVWAGDDEYWTVYSTGGQSLKACPSPTTREVSPPHPVTVPSIVSGTGRGTRMVGIAGVVAEGITGRPTPGVASDQVTAVAADAQGGLWAATLAGLSRFDGQGWVSFTGAGGLADDRFCEVAVDRRGDVWAGGDNGVTHFDGKRWTYYASVRGCHRIAAAPNGDIWVTAGRMTAYRFDGIDWWRYGPEDGLFDPLYLNIRGVTVDRSGVVWIGCGYAEFGGGPTYSLASFDGSQWVLYDLPETRVIGNTCGLHVDAADRLWVGTNNGLAVRDAQGWQLYPDPPFAYAATIAEDRAGRMWVCGGASNEVGFLQGNQWTAIAFDEVVPQFFAIDTRGDVWLDGDPMGAVVRWANAGLPTLVQGGLGSASPARAERLSVAPNPFNQQVEVKFALPQTANITLQVLDVAGQHVTTLAQGDYPAGAHTVVWDALEGRYGVASGVYLFRLAGAGIPLVRKISLVR